MSQRALWSAGSRARARSHACLFESILSARAPTCGPRTGGASGRARVRKDGYAYGVGGWQQQPVYSFEGHGPANGAFAFPSCRELQASSRSWVYTTLRAVSPRHCVQVRRLLMYRARAGPLVHDCTALSVTLTKDLQEWTQKKSEKWI